MRISTQFCCAVTCVCLMPLLSAQDAVKTDPKHYTLVSENDKVRILKVHYGPHEKSIMHAHPDSVAVFLSASTVQFTAPDGQKQTMTVKPGQAQFTKADVHLPENVGDGDTDLVLVELKTRK